MRPILRPAARPRTPAHIMVIASAAVMLLAGYLVAGAPLRAGAAGTPKAAACGGSNLALNRPATASSTENSGTPASAAVDGNTGTRWSSAFSDPQWLQVDLGSAQQICQVTLTWEAAYATSFQIQVSDTGNGGWTTVYSTTTGTGGTQTLSVTGTGRYSG
jgi:F5/8 type C domain